MSGMTVFRSVYLIVSLVCIALGLSARSPTERLVLTVGIIGLASAMLYFLNGRVNQSVLILLAIATVMVGAIWGGLLIRQSRLRRSQHSESA